MDIILYSYISTDAILSETNLSYSFLSHCYCAFHFSSPSLPLSKKLAGSSNSDMQTDKSNPPSYLILIQAALFNYTISRPHSARMIAFSA